MCGHDLLSKLRGIRPAVNSKKCEKSESSRPKNRCKGLSVAKSTEGKHSKHEKWKRKTNKNADINVERISFGYNKSVRARGYLKVLLEFGKDQIA